MQEESGSSAEGFSEAILGGFGEGAGDEWLVNIDCPTCGLQETVWVTGHGGRVPRAEDAYPPLCPCCESFAEPQPRVISIEKLRAADDPESPRQVFEGLLRAYSHARTKLIREHARSPEEVLGLLERELGLWRERYEKTTRNENP